MHCGRGILVNRLSASDPEPTKTGLKSRSAARPGVISPMDQSPNEPIIVPVSPLALRDRATIARLLLERHTPSICAFREVMEAGALISYGVSLVSLFVTLRHSS